ncbi:MAG: phosphotransferase [Pseudomonadota bacterium]
MSDREPEIRRFLAAAGWGAAHRDPLAGDASARRYDRLTDPATGATAVLMMAAAGDRNGVLTFARLARDLNAAGLSAPSIIAENAADALLLLEDLGDATFTHLLDTKAASQVASETTLYGAATDLLHDLHRLPVPPEALRLDSATLGEMTGIAFERYAAPITGQNAGPEIIPRLTALFEEALSGPLVFCHRDYHADNLLWLPERSGPARVGLLDFQDAVAGPAVYDLVSLLQDARRDVDPALATAMTERFGAAAGLASADLSRACALVGLQRNLRILGVFARLAQDFGKPQYRRFAPRVFAHVERNLTHPSLEPVASLIRDALPVPTPARLNQVFPDP